MENLASSLPPLRDQFTVSLAVNVWTAIVFSGIDLFAVASPALPEGPEIRGAMVSFVVVSDA